MRFIAIALFALVVVRCEAGDFTGSALKITGKRGAIDRPVGEQVKRIVSSAARDHRLVVGPVNPTRPDHLLEENLFYTYYPSRSKTTILLYLRLERHDPIEIEITESGVAHPSRAHRALLRDVRRRLSKSGLSVKRGEPHSILTD